MTMTTQRATAPYVQVLLRKQADDMEAMRHKRVAAYCRVSTDMEQQESSLENQMSSFRALIAAQPGWELAGIYPDEGLSGTRTANRVQFQKMIADCEAGKIDYIVTKSISRFARNTMECLQYVRRLKDLGIYVYFDENHFDTGSSSSEMLLSILAAVAQEESHSISENMKWGFRKRFQAGHPKWTLTYGFVKGEDGQYRINEEQAKGARRIFELYVSGTSLLEISRILQKENIPAMNGGKWWPKSLATVLHNEKYMGDVMMQKCYTVDHISHKKVKNDQTLVPSYYVRDHHEAIVSRKTFELAQTILSLKDRHQGYVQYPYYGTLICPFCGEKMVSFHLPFSGYLSAWTCGGGAEGSKCPYYSVQTKYVDRIVQEAYAHIDMERVRVLADNGGIEAEAAKALLEWKKRHPRLQRVEYIFLDALIEKITFINWNEAVVFWRFGEKAQLNITYDKIFEIPTVALTQTEQGILFQNKRVPYGYQVKQRVDQTVACCQKARAQMVHGRPNGIKKGAHANDDPKA
ncbi:MAG: recombinase family protein [Clostridia bacterium]